MPFFLGLISYFCYQTNTMRKLLVFLSVGLAACTTQEMSSVVHTDAFDKLLDQYYEDYLRLNPLEATRIADYRYNDQFPNTLTHEYREQVRGLYRQYLDSLAQFDRESLPDDHQVSYDVLKWEAELALAGLEFPDHLMPVQQFSSLTLYMPVLGSGQSFQPFKTAKHYDDWLARIEGFTVWMDTAIVNMRKGLAQGYSYPRILMERVLPQAQDMMVKDATRSIFYQPILNMPDSIADADRKRLTDAYVRAIREKIVPTYSKLYDFLRREYIPRARTSAGINAIPGGDAWYRFKIKEYTTTDLSPDSIFRLGESEVARIRAEMEKVKRQMDFDGTLQEFFEWVNKNPSFMPFTTDEEVISVYQAIEEKIAPRLNDLFNMKPQTAFEVRQTEEFRERSAAAQYSPGAPDGSRPGIFYVPIVDPTTYNVSGMETLFLHEAIPGHHYQVALQQENDGLPRFRRTLFYSAFGEGWALYAESLGRELGLFTDPIQYFGHLGDEMHRAIRLVVDVGLHTRGWTREQAIQYMRNNEPISEQGAVAEIERYMAIPGQALSYKIGQLKIRELRARAEQELGVKFMVGLFHDEVLRHGNVPLSLLEERVDRWIRKHKG